MYQTGSIGEERPPRAVRVVPAEPALRFTRWFMLSSIPVLVVYIVNLSLTFRSELWGHACLDIWGAYYVLFALWTLRFLPTLRTLEKRRQQAARYLLTMGDLARQREQPETIDGTLPDLFVMRSRRHWLGACLCILLIGLVLGAIGMFAFSYWQLSPQGVLHGVPLALVLLQNGLNIALFLFVALMFAHALLFTPRQELVATRTGLTLRQGRRVHTIRWEQARLFAIVDQNITRKQGRTVVYELASQDTLIRWPSTSKYRRRLLRNIALLEDVQTRAARSEAEFVQQVQFLNSIIAERTGLPLYEL